MNNMFNKNATMTNSTNRFKNCFLCDVRIQNTQIRTIDQLFYVEQKSNQSDSSKSLATILSNVLEHDLNESNVHSKIVCRKCHQMCNEYELMTKRLNDLRQTITNNYNATANKYLKAIEMDFENNYEAITENEDGNLSNLYAIESIDSTISEVFSNENNVPKSSQMKHKIMLIKSENGSSPFFAISDVDGEGIDDSQTIHTVLLEDINESIEFGGSATNTNDGMSDEPETDTGEQYIVTEHGLDESAKEYFESNGDQMIEISTNGEMNDTNDYQYVYQEDSSDVLNENTENDDDDDDEDEDDDEEEDENSLPKGITIHDKRMKNEAQFSVNTIIRASSSRKNNAIDEQKQLFIRDGKKFQCLLCQPRTNVVFDTKTISIHLKSDHNERVYVCSLCGLDFRKRNPYNEHMDDHMAESADGAYECEICKNVFTDARTFRIHKKTHSSTIKIWSCKACGKKYSSKNLLDEHMNMHTGEFGVL